MALDCAAISPSSPSRVDHGPRRSRAFLSSRMRRRRLLDLSVGEFSFDFRTLRTEFDPSAATLWIAMTFEDRACFTVEIMREMRELQMRIEERLAGATMCDTPLRYVVWRSDSSAAWSLGGDLAAFVEMIEGGDDAGLRSYAHLAVEIIHANYHAMGAPLTTVALVEGDAIGGGLEALLTHDVVVVEQGARFGLPETLFNLFPGMGAQSLLRRRIGEVEATRLITSGKSFDADAMKAMGLAHHVCAPGEGKGFVRDVVLRGGSAFRARHAVDCARRRAQRLERAELLDIVDLWVDLALRLERADLDRMRRLAAVQRRKRANGAA